MSFPISKTSNHNIVTRSNDRRLNRSSTFNRTIIPPYSRNNLMLVLLNNIIQMIKATLVESKVIWNRSIWLRPDISRESKASALEKMWKKY